MTQEEIIQNFQHSLDAMEEKFSSLENELQLINKSSKNDDLLVSSAPSSSSLVILDEITLNNEISNEKYDILMKQVQILKDENKNLSDDLREWKSAYNEKVIESERNREKYLNAQQLAEEYRRQLENFNKDNARKYEERISENLVMANERFKEQLGELGHLPFILEAKQMELQELQSKYKIAEKTISALSNDLEGCIVKCELQSRNLEYEKAKNLQLKQENETFQKEVLNWKNKYNDLQKENGLLLKSIEKMKFMEDCLQNKTKEVRDLLSQIESLKDEHNRHVSRIKERVDIQKRSFQTQVNGLEQELIQLRVTLNLTQQEREEIKLRMQNEISKIERKFNDSQLEIQNLKSHVEILKASYANMFEELEDDHDDDSDDEDSDNDNDNDDINDKYNIDENNDNSKCNGDGSNYNNISIISNNDEYDETETLVNENSYRQINEDDEENDCY